MKIFTFFSAILIFTALQSFSQFSFVNNNAQISGTTYSGCPVTVVDMNGDGLDDIVRLDQGHKVYIDYQRPGQTFSHNYIGDFGGGSGWAWGMCVADLDKNGIKDIVAGGFSPAVKILKMDVSGLSGTIISIPNSSFLVQNINCMDVNNDGWADIFVCDDDDESHIYLNDGTGSVAESNIIDFDVTATDDSGNYGSVWTDFDNDGDVDFYIAKCRQIGAIDDRRVDVLFENDGTNHYFSNAITYGLNDTGQTWTANFADIDNDGDLDVIQTDYNIPAKLLENDGTGHMTNITEGSGFDMGIFAMESVMEDFDNDGFVDILITGDTYVLFHNNGNKTFTKVSGVFGTDKMSSFAIGDLNHDGKIDLYSSYAHIYTTPSSTTPDVYWANTTANSNHFVTFNLVGTTSTPGAYGARVTLYGAFGTMVREVHAGESYGTCNTTNLHFGLGANTQIDSAIIRFQSGAITKIIKPTIDQFTTVKEGDCVSPSLTVSASGSLLFCSGETVTLTATALPVGFSYLWSNASTTQSITVNTSATSYVTAVSADNDCSVTAASVTTVLNPVEVPTISASGELVFCEGGSVILTSSTALGYTWSNGDTTQSITVNQSGSYSVTTQGNCQTWNSSATDVTMLASPAPVTTDAYIGGPENVTLTATGNTISWYDVAESGSPIATGNSFTTFANGGEIFYAEDQQSYNGDTYNTGQIFHTGNSNYSSSGSTNSTIIFDVIKECTLKSVKVYTDQPGDRLIELRNSSGDVLQSAIVNVPMDSGVVDLDFLLAPGSAYELGTNLDQNQILLGTDGPRLKRSSTGVTFPYELDNLISLVNTPFGTDYYYYFYDWQVVKSPIVCISARTPASVHLVLGIENNVLTNNFELFPNPSLGLVNIQSDLNVNGKVTVQVVDVAGRKLITQSKEGMKQGEEINIDLSSFAKGIYFINVLSGENSIEHKVIIE
ncbi:MAG: FG-GAP-like repeat-containing protein [Chitinophagales bacterium]|nr:FG-GAP-like repeat-containing protein [Chitinophagales bacterium]